MSSQIRLGAIYSYVSIAVKLVVSLVYTPYMLRMMGASEYGIYSLAASIVSYLTVLDLGFGNAIVRYTSKYRAEGKVDEQAELFGTFLGLYMLIGLVSLLIGSFIVANLDSLFVKNMTELEVKRTKIVLVLMVVNIAFTFPMSIWGSIMTAYERFVFPKIVGIVKTIVNAAVMVVLLKFGYRAIAMVVVTTCLNFATLLLNLFYCKKYLGVKVRFAKVAPGFLKEVLVYSFWIFINVLMDKAYWSTGSIVLGAFSGTKAVAEYGVAFQLVSYYMLMTVATSNLVLPRFTALAVNGSDTTISDFFIKISRLQYYLCSLIISGFIVFGKRFVVLWAGSDYANSYYIALALMIPMTVDVIYSSAVKVLQARNQMKYRSLVCLASAFMSVVIQIPAAKYGGAIGVALAITFVFVVQVGILTVYYHKVQKLDMVSLFKNLLRQTIVPFLLVIVFSFFNVSGIPIGLCLLLGCVFVGLFAVLSWRFVLDEYERSIVGEMALRFTNKG